MHVPHHDFQVDRTSGLDAHFPARFSVQKTFVVIVLSDVAMIKSPT
jgi:hypothetical protein